MEIKVVTNLPDFKRQLVALGQRVEKRLVNRALRAAGRVFRDEAKRQAPVLKDLGNTRRAAGALRRGIYVGRSRSSSRKDAPAVFVGVRATPATKRRAAADPFYWRFLEAGWMPRGAGRRLKGGERFRKLQRDRSAKAGARRLEYPFLKPAFDTKRQQAVEAFSRSLTAGIEAESRKR